MTLKYAHLFGPVHSRRLGTSLGVDMVPFKICTLNCVYCECGETTELTGERKEYVSTKEIIEELTDYLSLNPPLDYVTFAGSGEPTLNTGIGDVIRFMKERFPSYKTALLTNGTLFTLPEVRQDVMNCDLVCPSLDAISDQAFSEINRPYGGLTNQQILEGLIAFSNDYRGLLWVEIFIVPGINDNPEELLAFKEILQKINPTRIQLNSLDRPGACDWVKVADTDQLKRIAALFSPLPVEIISRQSREQIKNEIIGYSAEETICSLLKRRPSTIEELSTLTGLTINQISLLLEKFISCGYVKSDVVDGRTFYRYS